jgi:hypothetical protein
MTRNTRLLQVLVVSSFAALIGCSGPKGTGGGTGGAEEETGGAGAGGTGGKAAGTGGSSAPDAGRPADTGGAPGTGGSPGVDAAPDTGGSAGTGGSGGTSGTGGVPGTGGGGPPSTQKFSFFVTSMVAMRELSKSQNGFGGDLRFGEATGLAGADKICRTIAEKAMPGNNKTWRAFLSASTGGPNGGATNAIDRIGEGPWYDRMGRLFSMNKAGLLAGPRPAGAPDVVNDFPNENGVANKMGTDNHDTLTASNKQGQFAGGGPGAACNDWTSVMPGTGRPMIGHAWPRNPGNLGSGGHWISDHSAPGCAAGINIMSGGGGGGTGTVGGGGGYGGIFCFALTP